eukprot:scaffold185_cov321-Prasinococcus_capsulatus_cf.AAC.2
MASATTSTAALGQLPLITGLGTSIAATHLLAALARELSEHAEHGKAAKEGGEGVDARDEFGVEYHVLVGLVEGGVRDQRAVAHAQAEKDLVARRHPRVRMHLHALHLSARVSTSTVARGEPPRQGRVSSG